MKCLGINLTKYVQVPYEEKYKTRKNKIKELNKWRDTLYLQIGKLNIVKMSVLPNMIYRFNIITIKNAASYFVDFDKIILKFIWRGKRPRRANAILKEKKIGEQTLLDAKTYYLAIVIETMW